jgi:hypothetical protein
VAYTTGPWSDPHPFHVRFVEMNVPKILPMFLTKSELAKGEWMMSRNDMQQARKVEQSVIGRRR